MTDGNHPVSVTLQRPLTKYCLIATDVEKYNALCEEQGYPELENITVQIIYEGFFPNAYNVPDAAPAGADTGYKYVSSVSEAGGNETTLGKDYVFVNGTESFVMVDIRFE